jgi:NADPH-dependent 2,4-dienoyl-CoA reductase/sulfur reductase-like enzyme/nitrite reductase/ring-hydroxylating ferredoxin subunit
VGGQEEEATGPDLTVGVDSHTVKEGDSIAGHANGEAVLLARSNGKCYAIGAKCTHYGGPLAEGLIVDGTVRCPWHHAAFDLATGRTSRPPALHDLPCWNVEERDGKVFVGEKKRSAAPAARPASGASDPMVIIGGGAAGTVAATTLRREGFDGRIIIFEAGSETPTDRPNLSKDYLAGDAPEEWMPLFPDEWYSENKVELTLNARVASIDSSSSEVILEDGRRQKYGSLLLATGATPIKLELAGYGPPVFYLRTLADSRAIITRALESKTAVVIGASFIGLEVAASLRKRGLDVTVIAPESLPLERVFGAEIGRFIKGTHQQNGVKFLLGQTVASLYEDGVVTSGGERVNADIVVAGVGVRPNITLAEGAGLEIDKGVLVNEYLETSAAGIFAAGDIARWPDAHTGNRIRVEHWVVAERQGQCAARNMMGKREKFTAVPFFWSNHYDVAIGYSGNAMSWDSIDLSGSLANHDAEVRYRSGDKLLAIATIYRDRTNLEAELAMERETQGTGASA